MEHELIDWFDENGKYMGEIDKAIAHKKGLWHKSVHVWILNNKNQVLLQKRCSQKKFFPNYWDCSFAGHIGAKEDSLQSALREGKEELGIDLTPNDLQFIFKIKEEFVWKDIVSKEFVDVFLCKKEINIEDLKFQEEEVECAKYFDFSEVLKENPSEKIFPHKEEYQKLLSIIKKNVSEKS